MGKDNNICLVRSVLTSIMQFACQLTPTCPHSINMHKKKCPHRAFIAFLLHLSTFFLGVLICLNVVVLLYIVVIWLTAIINLV